MNWFRFFITILLCFIISESYSQRMKYETCDDDNDGIITLNVQQFNYWIRVNYHSDINKPELYLTYKYNGVYKIVDLFDDNRTELKVCGRGNIDEDFYDIAINSRKEIYVTRGGNFSTKGSNNLYRLDPTTCNYEFIANLSEKIGADVSGSDHNVALSFDNQDNLYVGISNSKVFRANSGDFENFYVWKDFINGFPAGDFVKVIDNMYISWIDTRLVPAHKFMKVNVDENNNYINHRFMNTVEPYPLTYGLGSELGRLFGVNPDFVYEVSLDDYSFNTIYRRQLEDVWYGGAGMHEATTFTFSIHENENDAISNSRPIIGENYTTTNPYRQTLYLRVTNDSNNVLEEIIPIDIHVYDMPSSVDYTVDICVLPSQLPLTVNLEDYTSFINNEDRVTFKYYAYHNNSIANATSIPTEQIINSNSTFYIRTENENRCFSITELKLNLILNEEYDFPKEYGICDNETIVLSVPDVYKNVTWSGLSLLHSNQILTGNEICVSESGIYKVSVEYENGCKFDYKIKVNDAQKHFVSSLDVKGNVIKVNVNPFQGIYEYSIDNINWQTSNVFERLDNGVYFFWVRRIDEKSCFKKPYKYKLFFIPNLISPNNDGINDFWNINKVIEDYPEAHIVIYDRYGKLLLAGKAAKVLPWNGKYNNNSLPDGSVWFKIILDENETYEGSILIKNK